MTPDTDPGRYPPESKDAIREVLRRVLASDVFRNSENLRSFLAFIVDETLQGRGEQLSARVIATGALRRPDSNDQRDQSIVRVEAGRLRMFLYRYFNEEGAGEEIEILVPKGAYVPVFRRRGRMSGYDSGSDAPMPDPSGSVQDRTSALVENADNAPQIAAPVETSSRSVMEQPASGVRSGKWPAIAAALVAALLSVLLIFLTVWLRQSPDSVEAMRSTDQAATRRVLAGDLRPLLFVEIAPLPGGDTRRLTDVTDRLIVRLSRFELIRVITSQAEATPDWDAVARRWPLADRFLLRVSPCEDCATPHINVRLTGLPDGQRLYSGRVGLAHDEIESQLDWATTLIAGYNGAIHNRLRETEKGTSTPIACLLRLNDYFSSLSQELRTSLKSCFSHPEIFEQRDGLMMTGAAFMAIDAYWWNLTFRSAALEEAARISQLTVETFPNSPQGLHVRSFVVAAQGDHEAALRLAREANELNPLDMTIVASLGLRLMTVGRVEEAYALMRQAHSPQIAPPFWLSLNLTLASLALGLDAEFRRYAGELYHDTFPLVPPLRMLLAFESGAMEDARQIRAQFLRKHPLAARFVGWIMEAHLLNPELAARIMERIDKASSALD